MPRSRVDAQRTLSLRDARARDRRRCARRVRDAFSRRLRRRRRAQRGPGGRAHERRGGCAARRQAARRRLRRTAARARTRGRRGRRGRAPRCARGARARSARAARREARARNHFADARSASTGRTPSSRRRTSSRTRWAASTRSPASRRVPPLQNGANQAWKLLGLNGFGATLTAYYGAQLHGEGDWIDISAQECAAGMLELYGPRSGVDGLPSPRLGNRTNAIWGLYPAKDGYAGVCALHRQVPALYALIGDPELQQPKYMDPMERIKDDTELGAQGRARGSRRARRRSWSGLGAKHKVPIGAAMTPLDLLEQRVAAGARLLRRSGHARRPCARARPPVPRPAVARGRARAARRRHRRGATRLARRRAMKRLPLEGVRVARSHDDVGRPVRDARARRDGRGGGEDRVAARVGQRAHAAADRAPAAVERVLLLQRLRPRQEVADPRPRRSHAAASCSCSSSRSATS